MKNYILIILALSMVSSSFAATFTSKSNGTWGNALIWNYSGFDSDGIPDADDDVIISDGNIVRVATGSTVYCNNLDIDCNQGDGISNATLVIRGTGVLNVGGNVTMMDDFGGNTDVYAFINIVGKGALNVAGDIDMQNFDVNGSKISIVVTTGRLNLGGNFTFSFGNTGTLDGGLNGSVVEFSGSSAQTFVTQYSSFKYCNVENNNTGSGLTPDGNIDNTRFTGDLINNQTFSDGGFSIGIGDSLNNSGTYNATGALDVETDIINSGTISTNGCNINVAGNWENTGSYSYATGDIVSFDGTAGASTIDGNTSWYELHINNANGVTASSGNQDIYGILDIDQGTFTASTTVTLISNASGTAQMDNIGSGSYSGNLTVQRYINKSSQGYVSIGAPVSGATINSYHDGGIEAGQEFILTGYTGADYWTDGYWVNTYTYNESAAGAKSEGWVVPGSTGDAIGAGNSFKAEYIYADAATYNIAVTGPPQTGASGIPISFTSSGGASEDGWNLVSNPYPCTIDWQTIRGGISNMADGYLVYSDDVGNYAYWDGAAAAGTGGATQYIPSMQGFWIHATGNSTLSIAESDKAATQDPNFLKSANNQDHIFRMHLTGNVNQYSDEALIIVGDDYINAYESADLVKLLSPDSLEAPTLMSFSTDNVGLAFNKINQLGNLDIPLRATAGENAQGTYTLNFELPEGFILGSCITLEDLHTGTTTDLRSNNSYSYTTSDTTTLPRFIIHITKNFDTQVNGLSCMGTNDGQVMIEGVGITGSTFELFDGTGNSVYNNVAPNDAFAINNLTPGSYTLSTDYVGVCGNNNFDFVVDEPSLVNANFEFNQDTLYLNKGDILNVNNLSSGVSYSWDFGDGNVSTLENPSHTYIAPGIYQVLLTVDNENKGVCTETDSKNIVVMSAPLGIEDVTSNDIVKAYVKGNKIIADLNLANNTTVELNLVDLSGKVVTTKKVNIQNGKVVIANKNDLNATVYFVNIVYENKKVTESIVID